LTETDPTPDQSARSETSRSLVPRREPTEVEDRRGKGYVLVVDSDATRADGTFYALEKLGYVAHLAPSGEDALEFLTKNPYVLILTEVELQGMDGLEFISRARELNPFLAVVVLTNDATVQIAVRAMKLGAADVLPRDFNVDCLENLEELRVRVRDAIRASRLEESLHWQLRHRRSGEDPFDTIIRRSDGMEEVIEKCRRVAPSEATILITGESGTGKEILAKAIHEFSPRKNQRFVPINCAALAPQVIESELFGHEKGAFTGASMLRKGFFEHSNGGTIFLDEVGDIPLDIQVKLLRVLENREIIRVGSNTPIEVDVRVVSATHRDLEKLIEEGRFREDLFYRLKVVPIEIPPLRKRPMDIPPLVYHFLHYFAEYHHRPHFTNIEREALAALVSHPWKGNIRELKHAIESLVVIAPGPEITREDLPESVRQSQRRTDDSGDAVGGLVGMAIRDVEKELIRHTLTRVSGNRQEAARILGIGERTLYRKLKTYELG